MTSIYRDQCLNSFIYDLKEKLDNAELKYGHGDSWSEGDWETKCRADLMNHINKGDPLDVAAYCFFMWYHGWSTCEHD